MQRTTKIRKSLTRYHQTNKISDFQRKLKEGISNTKSSPDVYAFAGRTTNIYKFPPQDYKKLLHGNITKSYKKSPTRLEKLIYLKAKEISAGIHETN